MPEELGVVDGTLGRCPDTPNCVHTGLRHPDGTKALYLAAGLDRGDVMRRLRAVVESSPRARVVTATDRYLHAEVTSLLFRFVDDLELFITDEDELVVRSASRIGRSDLGANGRRVEQLRTALAEAQLLRTSD
jgi:uncharacterized protein (DUF1499 family)